MKSNAAIGDDIDPRAHYTVLRAMLVEQAKRLNELEQELQQFLEQYYDAVAKDIETLFALESARDAWMQEHMPEMRRMQQRIDATAEQTRASLSREAYRKAARNTHPDAVGGAHANGDIQRINRAKEEGDIATLLQAAMPTPPKANAQEETWHMTVLELKQWQEKLEFSTRALLDSPAYALYLKAFEARLAGRNWLDDMAHSIRRQVETEQRAIARKGVKAIADWRVA